VVPDWYGVRAEEFFRDGEIVRGVEVDARNAFGSFSWVDVGLLVTAIAAVALPLVSAARPPLGLGRAPALVIATMAIVAVGLIAFRLIDPPDLARSFGGEPIRVSEVDGVEVIRKAGAWLGLALSAVIAVAAGSLARRG